VDRVTAAAQKKWDDTKVEWERCQKEKAEAIAVKEEAVGKAAEEAVEAAQMRAIKVGVFGFCRILIRS